MEKNTILLCNDDYEPIEWLSIDQKGRLLDAIFKYSINGETEVDEDIKVAFLFLKKRIDRHNDAYEKTCVKRREAGKNGGKRRAANQATQANPSKSKQTQANPSKSKQIQADKDKDKDKDKDMDMDKDFPNGKDIDISSGDASISSSGQSPDAVAQSARKKRDFSKEIRETVDYYNARIAETGCALVTCKTLSDARTKSVRARLAEHGTDNVRAMIDKACASRFLNYEATNAPANIDWLFGPKNFPKVLDGNYDDRDRTSPAPKERLKSPIPEYTDEEWNRLTLWQQDEAVHKHYGI